ncbi:hypothetical protein G7Y79_00014g037460 [Physcia stellaris]|nr:hypothetical protein G7Y79_00014g037460 [Physcia stellaris]
MDSQTESTTPRLLAPHTPARAPQDLVKLGKVQKVKRTRMNKAKQGRPQHLSVSQKRKLVRLYIYTNLSLDAIRQLIEHFGTRKIQKRALQNHLKDLFIDRYNMLRPGGAEASHERIFQVRLCKTSKNRRHSIQESFELESPSPYPVINFPGSIPGQSVMDVNSRPCEELKEIWTTENSSETRTSVNHMESSLDTSHSSLDWGLASASSTLTAEHSYVWTPHDVQELPSSSGQLLAPVETVLLTFDDPFMGVTDNESLDHLLSRRQEMEAGNTMETATELSLANDDDASAIKLSLGREIGSHSGTNNTDCSAFNSLGTEPHEISSNTLPSRPFPKRIQSDKGNKNTNTFKSNQIKVYDSGSKKSDLKALIFSNTKSFSEERDYIEEIITTFSISTGSNPGSSGRSISGLPTGRVLDQPTSSNVSHRQRYLQPRASVLSQLTRSYLFDDDDDYPSIVLPGDYDHVQGYASIGACYNVLLYIIRSGVDVNRINAAGQTFLHVLRRHDLYEWDNLVTKVRERRNGEAFLYALSQHGLNEWSKLVRELEERGYDFNHRDVIGRTVWYLVPLSYRNELSVILQNFGITPDFEYVKTQVISHIRSSLTKDTIEDLLRGGANINERDEGGQTPLHVSITSGKPDITGVLLSHKPNLHARDVQGKGVLAAGQDALRRAKSNASMYAKITACMTLAIDAGAIAEPTSLHEWGLPNYKYWPGDPTQPRETMHGSWPNIQN